MRPLSWSLRKSGFLPALAALLALHAAACGDDDPIDPDPVPVDRISFLRGQVEEGAGFIGAPGISGPLASPAPTHLAHATVTMQRLTTNGVFEDVTKDSAITSLVGVFLVSARVSDQPDLVVLARKGDIRFRTIVTRPTAEDSTITVGPLNKETTVEAELWARVLAGSNGAVTSRISLGLFVEARVATLLSADPSIFDSAVAPLVGESIAHRAVLTAPNFGVAAALLGPIEAARHRAATALEERLDPASEMVIPTFAAWEAFFAAEREAYVSGGLRLGGRVVLPVGRGPGGVRARTGSTGERRSKRAEAGAGPGGGPGHPGCLEPAGAGPHAHCPGPHDAGDGGLIRANRSVSQTPSPGVRM